MKKNIITFLSLILLSSCSTPYLISPSTEEALEDNQYRISFRGNSYTSEEKLKNYISKRAAALCSNGNFEIREGVYTGYGTIPVWNGNLVDSIRLIPSHTIFPDSDGVSFTFSITTAYRILMWLVSETIGPNKDIFP